MQWGKYVALPFVIFALLCSSPIHALELPAVLKLLTSQLIHQQDKYISTAGRSARERIELDGLGNRGLGWQANNDIWEKYASRPGCFKRAITSCDKHRVDERSQQRAAISMALCEIQSATDGFVPAECAPFASELVQDGVPHADCLKELIKVDRFWVSYSGYHRDTAQFCDIYRRRQNNDVALDVFESAMQQQTDFLHHLKESDASRSEEHLRVMENLHSTQVKSIQEMQTLAQELTATTVAQQQQQITELSNAVAEALSGFLELPATLMSEVLSRLDPKILTPLLSRTELLSERLTSFDTRFASTMATNMELRDVAVSNLDLAREAQRGQLEFARLTAEFSDVFTQGIAHFNTTINAAVSAAATDINATFAHVTAHAFMELNATFTNLNDTLALATIQANSTFAHYNAAALELNTTVTFILAKIKKFETIFTASKNIVDYMFTLWHSVISAVSSICNMSRVYIVALSALAIVRRVMSPYTRLLHVYSPVLRLFKWVWPFQFSSRTPVDSSSNGTLRSFRNFRLSRKPSRRVRFAIPQEETVAGRNTAVARFSQTDRYTNSVTQLPSLHLPLLQAHHPGQQGKDLSTYRRAISLPPGL